MWLETSLRAASTWRRTSLFTGTSLFSVALYPSDPNILATERRRTNCEQHTKLCISTWNGYSRGKIYSTTTDFPTFILKVTSWLQCPSVTYGLCMPSAFHMTAEMTSGEFSVGAGRWGCRLAFLWSASEAQVDRKTLPYPTAGEQQDVTIEVQNPSLVLYFMGVSEVKSQNRKRSKLLMHHISTKCIPLSFMSL